MSLLPRLALALALLSGGVALAIGCGSDARATDPSRTIAPARCQRGAECIPDFTGDAESCSRFYHVQCGRGVQDTVKEPTKAQLDACLTAIRTGACSVVIDPTSTDQCSFLIENVPPPPPPDTGTPETEPDPDAATD